MPTISPEEHERLLDLPVVPPPSPDIVPNFENPHSSLVGPCKGVMYTVFVITSLVTLMRCFTQLKINRKFFVEDYFLTLSYSAFIALSILTLKAIELPLGVHQWDMTWRTLGKYVQLFAYIELAYNVVMVLLRTTILLQVLRAFVPRGTRNFTFWCAHIVMWSNLAYWVAGIFVLLFACSPKQAAWDPFIGGKCLDTNFLHLSNSSVNITCNILVMFLAQRVIWGLNLPGRKKASLSFLFFLGIISCVCTATQTYYAAYSFVHPGDEIYHASQEYMLAASEQCGGFLAATLPIAPKFFNVIRQSSVGVWTEDRIKSILHISSHVTTAAPTRDTWTFGRTQRKTNGHENLSDVEFEDLVQRSHSRQVGDSAAMAIQKTTTIQVQSSMRISQELHWEPEWALPVEETESTTTSERAMENDNS